MQQSLTELAKIYKSDKGIDYSWANGYTIFYDKLFAPRRNDSLKILEIGLGLENDISSLRMWKDFFPNALIYGFDIRDFQKYEEFRIKIFQGNQSKKEDLINGIRYFDEEHFDIIIDDGEHTSEAQQLTFATLFQYLNNDGIYIVEDVSFGNIKHPVIFAEHSFITFRHLILHKELLSPFFSLNEKLYIEHNLKSGYYIPNKDNTCCAFVLNKI